MWVVTVQGSKPGFVWTEAALEIPLSVRQKAVITLTLFFKADELPGIFVLYSLILCLSSSISAPYS